MSFLMLGAIMKSLIRWSATVGLVGTTIVGSLVGAGLRVLALTPEQIVQKAPPRADVLRSRMLKVRL